LVESLYLLFVHVLQCYKLTLSVCVWRWSCDLSHGSRWYFKW